jgi:hypothetical protein
MAKSDSGLLDDIENEVLSDAPLATVLRKAIVLGGRAGSPTLRDWATKELRGYQNADDVPEYRRINASIHVDAVADYNQITGQRIGVHQLPEAAREVMTESVRFYQGVGELESVLASAKDNEIRMGPAGSAEIVALINYQSKQKYQQVLDLYWKVHVSSVAGMLDHIRTTVAELVAEMRAGTPDGQELPTRDVADQAVEVAVRGRGNRVTIVQGSAGARVGDVVEVAKPEGAQPRRGWGWRLTRVGGAVVGAATIAGAVFAWMAVH